MKNGEEVRDPVQGPQRAAPLGPSKICGAHTSLVEGFSGGLMSPTLPAGPAPEPRLPWRPETASDASQSHALMPAGGHQDGAPPVATALARGCSGRPHFKEE